MGGVFGGSPPHALLSTTKLLASLSNSNHFQPPRTQCKSAIIPCNRYDGACAGLRHEGTLEPVQGCDMDQSLEQNVTGVLNNIREVAGKVRSWSSMLHCVRVSGNTQMSACA
eukprot:scaffold254091_cov23-Tisochrysis_lutea.AAC.1